ncbi:MAG: hypothetical protein ABJC13_19525 [Acidobacteriota bacterium]
MQPEEKQTLLSEAGVLAGITASAYLIAFLYERSYLGYYAIPPAMVRIGPDLILLVVAALLGWAWLIPWIVQPLTVRWPDHPSLRNKATRVCGVTLVALWPVQYYGWGWWWIGSFPIIVFLFVTEILWPVIAYRKRGSLKQRLIAGEEESTLGFRIPDSFATLHRSIWLIAIASFLAYTSGRGVAYSQTEYLVVEAEPSVVVLRVYSDSVLCARFDPQTNVLDSTIQIRVIGQAPALIFKHATTGRLKQPVEKVTSKQPKPR